MDRESSDSNDTERTAACVLEEDQGASFCIFELDSRLMGDNSTIEWGNSIFTVNSVTNLNLIQATPPLYSEVGSTIAISAQRAVFFVDTEATHINMSLDLFLDRNGDSYIALFNSTDSLISNYTVRVTPVNDSPIFSDNSPATGTFTATYSFPNIPFDASMGYHIGTISASDSDDLTVSYNFTATVTNDIRELFLIGETSGEISLRREINAADSGAYSFEITADDGSGGRANARVMFLIGYPPEFDSDQDGVLNEDDLDENGNGLIEISTAEELNQTRHLLDGTAFRTSATASPNRNGCGNGRDITSCNGYELTSNISLSSYNNWQPIGSCLSDSTCPSAMAFGGIFAGNNYTISNIVINTLTNANELNGVGLFGSINSDAVLHNLYIRNISISTANNFVGALVGYGHSAEVSSSYVTEANLIGNSSLGGMLGYGQNVTIIFSQVVGAKMRGINDYIGGLIGEGSGSQITSSYVAVANLSGTDYIGGLIGKGSGAQITSSYVAAANLSGADYLGGLIGEGDNSTINFVYAIGVDISGRGGSVGGLVGNASNAVIASSYAIRTKVTGINSVGGFVGYVGYPGSYTNVSNSYWDNETGPTDRPDITYPPTREGAPKTLVELQSPTTFSGSIYTEWANIWCDPATGEFTTDNDNPLAIDNNRVWILGTNTQYPVISCTPASPDGISTVNYQRLF